MKQVFKRYYVLFFSVSFIGLTLNSCYSPYSVQSFVPVKTTSCPDRIVVVEHVLNEPHIDDYPLYDSWRLQSVLGTDPLVGKMFFSGLKAQIPFQEMKTKEIRSLVSFDTSALIKSVKSGTFPVVDTVQLRRFLTAHQADGLVVVLRRFDITSANGGFGAFCRQQSFYYLYNQNGQLTKSASHSGKAVYYTTMRLKQLMAPA
jgi:hypothetical protein